jgi:His/Glu/Gln/Arg/opine family amino acid ABC transporter permease subunit
MSLSIDIIGMLLLLCKGMFNNLALWFVGGILSLCGGILLGCFSCRQASSTVYARCIQVYVIVMRSIPLYVHMLYVYFVIPAVLGINLSPWCAALLAIVLCVTAYCTEVIRGGINAIPHGQWEAAYVLGYSYRQTLRYIIMPQVIRAAIPSLVNLSEELIKSTAIVSTVGVMDITRTGMNIIARTMNPELVYTLIAFIYLAVSLAIQALLHMIVRLYAIT